MVKTLEIRVPITTIDVIDSSEPVDLQLNREVYLDGDRAPKTLETIILVGLDVLGEQYLMAVEKEMKAMK